MLSKKLDIKYYLLLFIETFSIWQMGIIFYSSKTLTINNLINLPVDLNNSIFVVFVAYLIGIITIYLFPNKTILLGRYSMIISLLSSILLFLPININLFFILYYILTFNCVFFISINTSLIINYYSLKTALMDGILGTIISSLGIVICQNMVYPLTFTTFNIVSIIIISLITFALFKLPNDYKINFINKETKIKIPPKNKIIGLILIQTLCCLNTLFTASLSENIKNGISISYLGGFIGGVIFLMLYKKFNFSPFKIVTYYFAIAALGFLIYLFEPINFQYLSLFLQGFNLLIIMLAPFLISLLFDIYPSKIVAPITVFIAFLTVIINSIIIEAFRNNPKFLYSIYAFVSIFAVIIYFLIYNNLELQNNNEIIILDKLTKREKEVTELIIQGFSVKQIADILYISEHTVKEYNKKIFKKYNVHSKVELIAKINKCSK